MTDKTRKTASTRRAGFTLLEVLGAVAILGISYIMLATVSIQGLQAIGQSQRRIEASLLADETLIDLEIATETGQVLEPRVDTWESGPFEVTVEILDLAEIHEGEIDPDEAEGLLEYLAAEANGPFAPYRERNVLLGNLREIHISVGWRDAADEIEVTRTAYIYDQKAWIEQEQSEEPVEQKEGEAQDSESGDDAQDQARGRSRGGAR